MPATYFFRGQSAPVQLRNAVGFRNKNDRFVLASLVDTSGYSTDIQEKYQGLFITEVKLKIGEAFLAPGSYGFGFKDGKFLILDVAADEILSVPFKTDDSIAHPVPLKLMLREQDIAVCRQKMGWSERITSLIVDRAYRTSLSQQNKSPRLSVGFLSFCGVAA